MQMNLPSISENLARVLLEEHFKERMWNMDYYSWPKMYPNTGGGNPDGTPPNGGTPGTPALSLPESWVLPSAVAA